MHKKQISRAAWHIISINSPQPKENHHLDELSVESVLAVRRKECYKKIRSAHTLRIS